MNHRVLLFLCLAAICGRLPELHSAQQEKNASLPPNATAAIRQQIDELKAGQQRILDQLNEIKILLQERPARADYAAKPIPPENISLGVRGEWFRGDSKAPVAIMEYSDFDCSFCAKFASEIYPRLESEYIKTGKIRYFFRDLPAPEHTNSLYKARIARCAGDQGHFWEMHDWLFAHTGAVDEPAMIAELKTLDVDIPAFNECLTTGRFTENILRSAAGARRMALLGTPAFLIGIVAEDGETIRVSKVLVGGESFDAFRSILDPLLSAAPKK